METATRQPFTPLSDYPTFPAWTKIKDRPAPDPDQMAERIGPFRRVLDTHACETVRWTGREQTRRTLLIDVQTANAVVKVHDALSPESRSTFLALEPDEMGTMAWKLVK